jgi:hypothetical protein
MVIRPSSPSPSPTPTPSDDSHTDTTDEYQPSRYPCRIHDYPFYLVYTDTEGCCYCDVDDEDTATRQRQRRRTFLSFAREHAHGRYRQPDSAEVEPDGAFYGFPPPPPPPSHHSRKTSRSEIVAVAVTRRRRTASRFGRPRYHDMSASSGSTTVGKGGKLQRKILIMGSRSVGESLRRGGNCTTVLITSRNIARRQIIAHDAIRRAEYVCRVILPYHRSGAQQGDRT